MRSSHCFYTDGTFLQLKNILGQKIVLWHLHTYMVRVLVAELLVNFRRAKRADKCPRNPAPEPSPYMCVNKSRRVFPRLFWVLPNFHGCFHSSIETENMFPRKHRDEKKENNLKKTTCSLWLSKCKFSYLPPSFRQQLALVLCLRRVLVANPINHPRIFSGCILIKYTYKCISKN